MKNMFKSFVVVGLLSVMFSCSEKKGFDKVKEGTAEMVSEVSEEVDEVSEESKEKKIKMKFGK